MNPKADPFVSDDSITWLSVSISVGLRGMFCTTEEGGRGGQWHHLEHGILIPTSVKIHLECMFIGKSLAS